MSQFAVGSRAPGICDRCGQEYKLKKLQSETVAGKKNNVRVCRKCWDEDHPQLFLGRVRVYDPQGLRNPRSDSFELDSVRSLTGWAPVGNAAIVLTALAGTASSRV